MARLVRRARHRVRRHLRSVVASGQRRTLVAGDGLHPSGVQYAPWVERIAPVVARLLGGLTADTTFRLLCERTDITSLMT